MILAPRVVHRKGEHKDVLDEARRSGFVRVRINGKVLSLDETITLNKQQWHTIDIVVDRLVINDNLERNRVIDSIETALRFGDGQVRTSDLDSQHEQIFSEQFACVHCNISFSTIRVVCCQ